MTEARDRYFGIPYMAYRDVKPSHGLEVIIIALAGCHPLQYRWEQYTDRTSIGSCIDLKLFYYINGIIGLVIDIAVLVVPIPTSKYFHINISRTQ